MKCFIVFAAVVAVACANSVGRAGWGAPPKPNIDLELAAAAAAAGAGQTSGGQALLESVVGNLDIPAQLSSLNGLQGQVAQGEDISQVETANKPSGATSTINAADAYNLAGTDDVLQATLIGGVAAAVVNDAHTDAEGEGSVAVEESSLNSSQTRAKKA